MLADVAGFDLPPWRIIGRVGQAAAFEALDEDVVRGTGDLDGGPVGFGNGEAGGVVGALEEWTAGEAAVRVDGAFGGDELPENRGDGVVGVCHVVSDRKSVV